jgi:hypothetical protein
MNWLNLHSTIPLPDSVPQITASHRGLERISHLQLFVLAQNRSAAQQRMPCHQRGLIWAPAWNAQLYGYVLLKGAPEMRCHDSALQVFYNRIMINKDSKSRLYIIRWTGNRWIKTAYQFQPLRNSENGISSYKIFSHMVNLAQLMIRNTTYKSSQYPGQDLLVASASELLSTLTYSR